MNKISLNKNQIKYIAITAMLIDHIAWAFVPTATVLGQVMHFIGRFTGPTMAYFLYEGFIYTSDKRKYGTRLFIFALISQVPFASFEYGSWCIGPVTNVIWTLFLSFLGLCFIDFVNTKWEKGRVLIPVVLSLLCFISLFSDWFIFDILWPAFLFLHKDDKKKQWTYYWIVMAAAVGSLFLMGNITENLYQIGCIIPGLVLMFCYNGQLGKKTKFGKWAFYIFYPLHLLIIAVIKIYFVG